jgi:hypothetical protein
MDAKEFESRSEAMDEAVALLPRDVFRSDADARTFLASAELIGPLKASRSQLPKGAQPALVGRFAIRDDVFLNVSNFLALLSAAAKLCIGISSIHSLAGASSTLGAIESVYKLFCTIRDRSFILTEEQLAVVLALRELKSASIREIAERMGGPATSLQVETALKALECTKEQPSGFTVRQGDRWMVKGL